ncbi:MAG: YdcH family protein [Chromatiales bacterium]|nr:YdcH family protein [Chromatiales bacterium]
MKDNVHSGAFAQRALLRELRIAHRDIDQAIGELAEDPCSDQLRIRRLKKQRLRLKDQITRLESALIPDLNA